MCSSEELNCGHKQVHHQQINKISIAKKLHYFRALLQITFHVITFLEVINQLPNQHLENSKLQTMLIHEIRVFTIKRGENPQAVTAQFGTVSLFRFNDKLGSPQTKPRRIFIDMNRNTAIISRAV
jgi:hypothetical protein